MKLLWFILVVVLIPQTSLCFLRTRTTTARTTTATTTTKLHSFLDELKSRWAKMSTKKEVPKTESERMIELLEDKPWRAPKKKNLNIVYRPWKDSYLERYRQEDNDDIYLYSLSDLAFEGTRVDDLWGFPWFWTKPKIERLGWIHKVFDNDVDSVTVQEHMEMDCFYAEYDMPFRWSMVRILENNLLNIGVLNLVYLTDFHGVKPTDLGLRPDGTLKTCPVQFHACISSSQSPTDTTHYAPPIKWSRSKSPEQAYDEVKSAYLNYPKRGLRYSSGFVDRGGWFPQQFGGTYFHAQADTLVWGLTEDIELKMDLETRELRYRSSARMGQWDWDVENLRYNQFVKMLKKNGGWEGEPLERVRWAMNSPLRWTKLVLDKASTAVEHTADIVVATVLSGSEGGGSAGDFDDAAGAARQALDQLSATVEPLLAPIKAETDRVVDTLLTDPMVEGVVRQAVGVMEEMNKAASELQSGVQDMMKQQQQRMPQEAPIDGVDASGQSPSQTAPAPAIPPLSLFPDGFSSTTDDDELLRAYSALSSPPSSSSAAASSSLSTSSSSSMVAPVPDNSNSIMDNSTPSTATTVRSPVSTTDGTAKNSIDDQASTTLMSPSTRETDDRVVADDRRQWRGGSRGSSRSNGGNNRASSSSGDGKVVMNANDVEWVVESRDGASQEEPSSSLLSQPVASKRPSQQRRNKEPERFDKLEQRVMKARLDELRSTFHLYDDPATTTSSSSIEKETKKLLFERFKR